MDEIKRSEFKFKVYGVEHTLNAPSMRTAQVFQKKVASEPEKEMDFTIEFLATLGMNEEAAWELEPDHVKKILKEVTGQKKS